MRYLLCLFLVFFLTVPLWAADSGDTTSANLVTNAAKCLEKKDWKGLKANALKCIQLYEQEALKMQKKLKDFPPEDTALDHWALNDVAYAYFLLGELYLARNNLELAKKKFERVVKKFKFAQVLDPGKKSYWKVADAAKSRLSEVNSRLKELEKSPKGNLKKLRDLKEDSSE